MPVATEISNIERRGHVYYWRARVPARVPCARSPEGKYARFSISLKQSDHRRACYMARRLNTLLAELTLGPCAAMTDKEKLKAIFRAEIEQMSRQLDDVMMMARRAGRTDDVREMEADIEVGWANRLIQLYGAARKLTFQEGCPGRALLLRAGIPADHVPIISQTFEGECAYARSRMFEDDLRARMEQAGLADTLPNRERAKIEFFRARADALLNVGERWPLTDRQSTALTRSTLSESERCSSEQPARVDATSQTDVPGAAEKASSWDNRFKVEQGVHSAPTVQGVHLGSIGSTHTSFFITTPLISHTYVSASSPVKTMPEQAPKPVEPAMVQECTPAVSPVIQPAVQTQEASACVPSAPINAASQKPVLQLAGFEDEWERMTKNHKEEWRDATAADARVLVCLFHDILEEHGIRHSDEIAQHHIAALRDHFNWVPIKYGQSARMRAMTELLAVVRRPKLLIGTAAGKAAHPRLCPSPCRPGD